MANLKRELNKKQQNIYVRIVKSLELFRFSAIFIYLKKKENEQLILDLAMPFETNSRPDIFWIFKSLTTT